MYTKDIGNLLIAKGEKFCSTGKAGIISVLAGFGLAMLICLISFIGYGELYFFDGYAITAFGWILSILLVLIGSFMTPFFFFGLHYMGLGQICENTKK